MGFYIETSVVKGKAIEIISLHDARPLDGVEEARAAYAAGEGVICVVDNGPFEAAGFCFSERELEEFANPRDRRPKSWLTMDRARAERLSGYTL